MSGHRKFSELMEEWYSPEERRQIKAEAAKMLARMDREVHIEPIVLEWSEWHSWRDVERDAREGGVAVPNEQPGVYEARLIGREDRLMIGRASDLRMRIIQVMLWNGGHPAGEEIRAHENVEDVVVRWAVTERPAAVEEELHIRHEGRFGDLPKYTHRYLGVGGLVWGGNYYSSVKQRWEAVSQGHLPKVEVIQDTRARDVEGSQ